MINFRQIKALRDAAFTDASGLNDWERNYVRRKTDLSFDKLSDSELAKLSELHAKFVD